MNTRIGCLYLVTAPSGHQYVGISSQGTKKRWRDHQKAARRGVKTPLNSAIKKYGAAAFTVRTLVVTTWEELNRLEPLVIKAYGTRWPDGYNLREGGSQSTPHSESSALQAAKMRGRRHSEQQRKAHTAAMSSLEVRTKLSEAHKGHTHSEETKAKMSAARKDRRFGTGMLGRKHSSETREKMRKAALRRRKAS